MYFSRILIKLTSIFLHVDHSHHYNHRTLLKYKKKSLSPPESSASISADGVCCACIAYCSQWFLTRLGVLGSSTARPAPGLRNACKPLVALCGMPAEFSCVQCNSRTGFFSKSKWFCFSQQGEDGSEGCRWAGCRTFSLFWGNRPGEDAFAEWVCILKVARVWDFRDNCVTVQQHLWKSES